MEIKKNVSLKKYTTLKIGGVAENFYIPKTVEDIKNIAERIDGKYYVISNGSNLLINDKKVFKDVIYMKEFEKRLVVKNGIIEASSSVKIQELINFSNENNLGGIEYLYSVPATIGGAVYMNAGRGKIYKQSISNYILNVTIFDGKSIRTLSNEECKFRYRHSIFKEENWIILFVSFKFQNVDLEESKNIKAERIEYSKKIQDAGNSNAGSVFSISNTRIMSFLRKNHVGWKNGICYSNKTNNWINNYGNGTYKQAKVLINFTKLLHKLLLKKNKLEYIDWK